MDSKLSEKEKIEVDNLQSVYQLCFNIPKIELHAHIGGWLRPNTFLELADAKGINVDHIDFYNITLKSAFDIFSIVGKVVINLDVLRRVVTEIIEDYSKSNTRYLELRTSPKAFENSTKTEYLDTVLSVFEECESLYPHIIVRLVLSINRSTTMESNIECFELAKEFIVERKSKYVVGIEFSGEPNTNSFEDYTEQIFEPAKELGIKISIHTAEIKEHHAETASIFDFKPDRLGHWWYLNQEELDIVCEKQIPVEVCPSSNRATMGLSGIYELENVKSLYQKGNILFILALFTLNMYIGCTIIPCWDDTMLFNTNAINETFELVNLLGLSELDLKTMMIKATDAIFDESVKQSVKSDIESITVRGEVKEEAKQTEEDEKVDQD